MVEELKRLKQRLAEERPVEWESLPDLSLYMDQVLSYMTRQLIGLGEDGALTSAMVNNYIKDGLLPRAAGKRYSKTHLAYLTAICALKQVVSVKEAHLMIQTAEKYVGLEEDDAQREEKLHRVYDYFRSQLDTALRETSDAIPDELCEEEDPNALVILALSFALRSYADQLACQHILEMLQPEPPGGKRKKEKE